MSDAGENGPLLAVRGVEKRYDETRALAGVSFEVTGGVVGLLGANGAGKSTLFRAIVDLVPLDAGTIAVAGFDSRRDSLEVRRRIGYLPEEPRFYELLTGRELLAMVASLKGLASAEEGCEIAARFGLGERLDVLVGEYSLGMRKKVGLASALMGSPSLVLLDEPMNGLDTESMRRLRLMIEERAAAGTTFLLSSHVMSFVERICVRALVLRRGELVADGSPAELRRASGLGDQAAFEDVFLALAL